MIFFSLFIICIWSKNNYYSQGEEEEKDRKIFVLIVKLKIYKDTFASNVNTSIQMRYLQRLQRRKTTARRLIKICRKHSFDLSFQQIYHCQKYSHASLYTIIIRKRLRFFSSLNSKSQASKQTPRNRRTIFI